MLTRIRAWNMHVNCTCVHSKVTHLRHRTPWFAYCALRGYEGQKEMKLGKQQLVITIWADQGHTHFKPTTFIKDPEIQTEGESHFLKIGYKDFFLERYQEFGYHTFKRWDWDIIKQNPTLPWLSMMRWGNNYLRPPLCPSNGELKQWIAMSIVNDPNVWDDWHAV